MSSTNQKHASRCKCRGDSFARRNSSWIAVAAIALAFSVTIPAQLLAHGTVTSVRGHDLQITIDSTWAGNAHGGYYPIRLRVINRGPSRVLTFQLRSRHEPMPVVRRTVQVDQNATARFTLSAPMVSESTYAELSVIENGSVLSGLSQHLNFPGLSYDAARPSLLVISATNVNCDNYEFAVNNIMARVGGAHGGYGGSLSEDHEIVHPDMLPSSWIDYTGIDIVATPLKTLQTMPQENRSAIMKWVQTGGILAIYEVGESAPSSRPLNELIALNRYASAKPDWTHADPKQRSVIRRTDQYGNEVAEEGNANNNQQNQFVWPNSAHTFSRIELMNGSIYAFKENPFPGSEHDWAWFLNSINHSDLHWTNRNGISPRLDSTEFLQFLIPGITGVPVCAFLVLITIFTVVIGPLNYILLSRQKRLYLLLVTIPLVAFVTSLSLFGYSVVAHGFSTKSRVRSITFLDQKNQTAVSKNRIALYAGLASSDGLSFSSETAVFPIWPQSEGFEAGTTDWTETQNLNSGWLRSRTRTQFLTIAHRDERGRIEISPIADGKLPITNGLEWDVISIVLSNADGKLFYGSDLPAGSSTKLVPANRGHLDIFVQQVKAHPLKLPEQFSGSESVDVFSGFNSRRWWGGTNTNIRFKNSQMERHFSRLSLMHEMGELPRNSYVAALKQNPNVELGVKETIERASIYILVGYF